MWRTQPPLPYPRSLLPPRAPVPFRWRPLPPWHRPLPGVTRVSWDTVAPCPPVCREAGRSPSSLARQQILGPVACCELNSLQSYSTAPAISLRNARRQTFTSSWSSPGLFIVLSKPTSLRVVHGDGDVVKKSANGNTGQVRWGCDVDHAHLCAPHLTLTSPFLWWWCLEASISRTKGSYSLTIFF